MKQQQKEDKLKKNTNFN